MAQIQIGKNVYDVNPLLVEDSFDLQPKLLPVLPEIGRLISLFSTEFSLFAELDKKDDEARSDDEKDRITKEFAEQLAALLEKASPIIERVCKLLPAEDLRYIRRTLLRDATCGNTPLYSRDGRGDAINIFFAGDTIGLWRLIAFAVQISYPDFFGMAASLASRVRARGGSSAT